MRCCSFRSAKLFLAGVSLLVLLVSSCSAGIDVIPSAGTAAPECSITLDEDTLARLSLALYPSIEMQPGESRQLSVGVIECCMFLDPVDACTTWSVEPSEGATISPDGELTIDPATPGGAMFRVTADVEDGRQQVSADVYVYDPAENPLVGTWHEEAQMACGSQAEVAPEKPIQELRFFADGRVDVTWAPFETYVDYSGTYTFSEDGSIELSIAGGNYTPDDLDGMGRFTIDEEGRLVLEDMWLGSPQDGGDTANCGHGFR